MHHLILKVEFNEVIHVHLDAESVVTGAGIRGWPWDNQLLECWGDHDVEWVVHGITGAQCLSEEEYL